MPRFAVLEHDHPRLHWDLFLEAGPVLRAWRLAEPPRPADVILATAIGDHRLVYLDYEGPVSGNRGNVTRWDNGTYEWITQTERELCFVLSGSRLRGQARLEAEHSDAWRFCLVASDGQLSPTGSSPW